MIFAVLPEEIRYIIFSKSNFIDLINLYKTNDETIKYDLNNQKFWRYNLTRALAQGKSSVNNYRWQNVTYTFFFDLLDQYKHIEKCENKYKEKINLLKSGYRYINIYVSSLKNINLMRDISMSLEYNIFLNNFNLS